MSAQLDHMDGLWQYDPLEQSLIGLFCAAPDTIDAAIGHGLRSEHFREPFGQRCFAEVVRLNNSGTLSATSLLGALRGSEVHDRGREDWLNNGLTEPWRGDLNDAVDQVRERYLFRGLDQIGRITSRLATKRGGAPRAILDKLGDKIDKLRNDIASNDETGDVHELVVEAMRIATEGAGPRGLSTGFRRLDAMTGGMRPGQKWIVAASMSVGKTAFAGSVVRHRVVDQGGAAGWWSLEMPATEVTQRLIANEGRLELRSVMGARPMLRDAHIELSRAAAELDTPRLRIFEQPGASALDIRAKIPRLVREGIDLVVIDQLDIMSHPRTHGSSTHNNIRETTKELKRSAMRYKIPIVVLHQLTKNAAKRQAGVEGGAPKEPSIAELRDSAVENDADVVVLLHRPEAFLREKTPESMQGKAKVIVAKNRHGPTGSFMVDFHRQCARYEDER